MDYTNNVYIALHLSPGAQARSNPAHLSQVHPAVSHHGQVGELEDVQLVRVAKTDWEDATTRREIEDALRDTDGVNRFDVQEPKMRSKRDEF